VATVSATGLVTGLATGTVAILATSEGSSDSATITVQQQSPPPAGSFLFEADWSTATGNSDAALLDNGKSTPWGIIGGNNPLVRVVASRDEGLDFPTTNVLKVDFDAGNGAAKTVEFAAMPLLNVGETRYYRTYLRMAFPNGLSDPSTHPIQAGIATGAAAWIIDIMHNLADGWRFRFNLQQGLQNAAPWNLVYSPRLEKNTTYRIEWAIRRDGPLTFQLSARIFSVDGRPLYDDRDFTNSNGSGTLALGHSFNINDPTSLARITSGTNGLANPPSRFTYSYQAALCVRDGDWCGAYAGR
jgi:hypothetical protein